MSVVDEASRPDWHVDAVCAGLYGLFYSVHREDIDRAKALCHECPVIELCDDEGKRIELSANAVYGVRAGRSAEERKSDRRQPRRGGRTQ